jgi:hypothetical protein
MIEPLVRRDLPNPLQLDDMFVFVRLAAKPPETNEMNFSMTYMISERDR